jgi:NAD(P)H-nitrite reductase large subunit
MKTKELVKLFSLTDKSLNVIIRLANTNCSSCNRKSIEMIHELSGYNNLIVVSNAANMRELRLLVGENEIKQIIYCLDSAGKLFKEDDDTKNLIVYVKENGTILKAYYVEDDLLFLVKSIIPNQ